MNKVQKTFGATLIEILLCFAILSTSLYPIAFLFQNFGINNKTSEKEFLATLIAHHATETLIAKRSIDPSYIPKMTSNAPVAMKSEIPEIPHEYFESITASGSYITDSNESKLFNVIKDFTFTIDTYLLDTRFYKVICKINYNENNKNKQIFFERQLYGITKAPEEFIDSEYDDLSENVEDYSFVTE